jgi:uncharacterized membrane protein
MITEIVGVITEFAEAFWSVIVGGMTELSTAFYDDGSLTFVGTILFIGLGLFLVMFVVNWLRRLIKS